MARSRRSRRKSRSRSRSRKSKAGHDRFKVHHGRLFVTVVTLPVSRGKVKRKSRKKPKMQYALVKYDILKPKSTYNHPHMGKLSQKHPMFKPFIDRKRGVFYYLKNGRLVPLKVPKQFEKYVKNGKALKTSRKSRKSRKGSRKSRRSRSRKSKGSRRSRRSRR